MNGQQGGASPDVTVGEVTFLGNVYTGPLHQSSGIFLSIRIFTNQGKRCLAASSGSALNNSANSSS